MPKIAVYGSLREGEYNFERFQNAYPGQMKREYTTTIYGWSLYSLGSYPGIKKSDSSQKLVVDVMTVTDEVFKRLDNMERGAGYLAKEIVVQDDACIIWEYQYEPRLPRIEHGDWSKYLKDKKEENIILATV